MSSRCSTASRWCWRSVLPAMPSASAAARGSPEASTTTQPPAARNPRHEPVQPERGRVSMLRATTSALAIGAVAFAAALPAAAQDDPVAAAKAYVEQVTAPNPPWDGPTTGPAAQPGKSIVYASADQRNGGALGVGLGVEEAAKLLGWNFHLIDGRASVSGRSEALSQAIALNPDGIVLGTIDANEQAAAIQAAAAEGIVVVGWHATASPGPNDDPPIFTNITTDPLEVARAAASYAIADSDGKAGVVIFTDSVYEIAIAKSDAMAEVIEGCPDCQVLALEDTPSTSSRACRRSPRRCCSASAISGRMRSASTTCTSTSWHHRSRLPASTAAASRTTSRRATAARSPSSASAPASIRSAPSPSPCGCTAGRWSTS